MRFLRYCLRELKWLSEVVIEQLHLLWSETTLCGDVPRFFAVQIIVVLGFCFECKDNIIMWESQKQHPKISDYRKENLRRGAAGRATLKYGKIEILILVSHVDYIKHKGTKGQSFFSGYKDNKRLKSRHKALRRYILCGWKSL